MNYRHAYHAGNFADVIKHLVLLLCFDQMRQKEKGVFCCDAFAGPGLYDLSGPEARKTGEAAVGVARVMEQACADPSLRRYQDIVAPYWNRQTYPGSPLLLAEALRKQDRLLANELHPKDGEALRLTLGRFSNMKVTQEDAYEVLKGVLPPHERRGLIVVDPPFERPDEFAQLVSQMADWKKRFATGCYLIWYPIKAHLPLDAFYAAATALNLNRTWRAEFLVHERTQAETFNGSGLIVFNAPFQVPEKMQAASPELGRLLQGRLELNYLNEAAGC